MRISRRWAFIFWLLVPMIAGLARAGELDGDYQAKGENADGKSYTGEVRVRSLGGAEAVLWRLDSGEAYKGLGLLVDDVLGVAYGGGSANFGVVVYRIEGGRLDGQWTLPTLAKGKAGREVLEGSPELDGAYRIVLGENPDGTTNYDGTVKMQRQGDIYAVAWFTPGPQPTAVGIGIRQNDVLTVAYGASIKGLGVVAYTWNGDQLLGLWSSGSKRLGQETLTRKD